MVATFLDEDGRPYEEEGVVKYVVPYEGIFALFDEDAWIGDADTWRWA